VVEDKINPVVAVVYREAVLAAHEGETLPELQQKLLQVVA
jgi:hypothetical protein